MGMSQGVLKRERDNQAVPTRLGFHSPKQKQIALMSALQVGPSTDSHPAVFPTHPIALH